MTPCAPPAPQRCTPGVHVQRGRAALPHACAARAPRPRCTATPLRCTCTTVALHCHTPALHVHHGRAALSHPRAARAPRPRCTVTPPRCTCTRPRCTATSPPRRGARGRCGPGALRPAALAGAQARAGHRGADQTALAGATIAHFATHAVLDNGNPMYWRLMLARAGRTPRTAGDGPRPSAARGRHRALLGLLLAGASSILATEWKWPATAPPS